MERDSANEGDGPSAKLTGVVLTCNGEHIVEKCLSSLAFCHTILVVDSGSTDATLEIAQKCGAKIVSRSWEGFASQFTFAQSLVETPWFFILDQDEICPEPLANAILKAVEPGPVFADSSDIVAYSVGRKSWYFDRFMKHGGWYPDFILRLFRTGFVEFYEDAHIHYRPLGPSARLEGKDAEIVHYPYTSFFHQLAKLNSYAEGGAQTMRSSGKKGGIGKALSHGLFRFFRIYILKKGFLDGRAGFFAAAHGSIYAFLKYARVLDASWGVPYDWHEKDTK